MTGWRRQVGALLAGCVAAAAAAESNQLSWLHAELPVVELRGHVVAPDTNHVSFQTESGAIWNLARTRQAEALFTDTNVQAKTLVLRGQLLTNAQIFRVTKPLHSWHDGKLWDLHYFCDVCAIDQVEPGPCMCCREEVHLVETNPKSEDAARGAR